MADQVPIELTERVAAGECVLFMGPLASLAGPRQLGPPGPATLAAELADRLDYVPDDISLAWVSQLYEVQAGAQTLRDYVARRLLDDRYRPTRSHHLVADLNFQVIVSTALDTLLEQLVLAPGSQYTEVLVDDDLPAVTRPQFIKLYGTASHWNTMQLTEDDYQNLFDRKPKIADRLRDFSHSQSLLFVGHDLQDPKFRLLLWELGRRPSDNNAPAAYVFLPNPRHDEVQFWRRRELIALDIDPDEALETLRQAQARHRGQPPPPAVTVLEPPPLDEAARQSLREVVVKILDHIGIGVTAESRLQLQNAAGNLDFVRALLDEYARTMTEEEVVEDEVLTPVSRMNKREAMRLLQIGNAAWAERDFKEARLTFERAISQSPKLVEGYLNLHYLLAEMGELGEAGNVYRSLVAVEPNRALLPPKYEFEAVLGTSNLGPTYQARLRATSETHSVTILRSAIGRRVEALKEYVDTQKRLAHPGIPRLIEAGSHAGRYFIAREYVPGQVLGERLDDQPLAIDEALDILCRAGQVLSYAASQGVPHLSFNPMAIVQVADGGLRILHFGDADLLGERLIEASRLLDTADYLAPEQLAGQKGDGRSDVYALATLAHKLFTGQRPAETTFKTPSQLNPEAGEALDILVAHGRATDPAQRFSSVEEMEREIERLAQIDRPGLEYLVTQPMRRLLRWLSKTVERLPRRVSLAILAFLVLANIGLDALPDGGPEALRITARILLLLVANIFFARLLTNLRVRDLARRIGLGSLIHSAQGMGVLFGFLMTLWMLFNNAWDAAAEPGLANLVAIGRPPGGLAPGSFWLFVLVGVILNFFVTYLMLFLCHAGGRLAQRRYQRYTGGFYVTFTGLCLLLLLLTVLPLLYGSIAFP